jgi:DNA-binding transcriptional regulator YiaG
MGPFNPCPICGQQIPERPRGSRHGNPPKACSEQCRAERRRRLERERYHRVKHSESWKATRRRYLKKLRARLDADPEFAVIFRAEAAARTREWREQIRRTDPDRYEQMKAAARAERAAWYQQLISDPAAWEAHRAKCRAWYHSLSEAERNRIFYEPRRRRLKRKKGMTPDDIKSWRSSLALSQRKAATALGISERMYIYCERGRREDGRPVAIPRTVALACSALAHGLEPYGEG